MKQIANRLKDRMADRVYKVGRRPDEADSRSGYRFDAREGAYAGYPGRLGSAARI
jgi:hypothetical protein